MSTKKEEKMAGLVIENEVLASESFSNALGKICNQVWGKQKDEELFGLLDVITTKQKKFNHLREKYVKEVGATPGMPATPEQDAAFRKLWEPIIKASTMLDGITERVVLYVKDDGPNITAIERLQIRDVIEVRIGKEKQPQDKE
jgi:hypothetical protein